jgi:hypothetical protein
MVVAARARDLASMQRTPRIRRLGLVRVSREDESVRRYLLARLDDLSLPNRPELAPSTPLQRRATS